MHEAAVPTTPTDGLITFGVIYVLITAAGNLSTHLWMWMSEPARPESLALAWTAPMDANGQRLPHGLGWFVQLYNGERIVWQFGVGDNASSSLVVTIPGRGITLILLANSQGLVRPFSLTAGDVTVSPFARVFLSLFVR